MSPSNPAEVTGYWHSRETFGTVDGPGIRYVLFLRLFARLPLLP